MKTNRGLVRMAVLVVLASCMGAGFARAQAAVGKFTLPCNARWGAAILPAGEYSFTLNHATASGMITVFRGTSGVALITSQSYSEISSGRSALTIVRDSSGTTVRDLSLPELGMVFHYAPHKSKRSGAEAEREAVLRVPVFTTAK